MIQGNKISLVIPCYNEADGLAAMFKKDLNTVDEIVVVDNNCTDDTTKIARQYGCRVVEEKVKGYGAAYKAGFNAASGDIIVTMDGDNTYPVEEIARLVGILLEENLDFVSANRLTGGRPASMNRLNYFGNVILTIAAQILFFRKISDSQSGMWIFRKSIFEKVKLRSDGMAMSQEIKLETIKQGCRFKEVDIPYNERLGEVKLSKWKDGIKNLTFLFYKRFF